MEEILIAAGEFLNNTAKTRVFAFHGEMGAGKTTFIHALCELSGVTGAVGSPTFPIINEYESAGGPIFHIDLYRLCDEAEVRNAGVEDCLYSGDRCFVEWPERAPAIFPDDTVHVYIEMKDSITRKLTWRSNA